MAVVKIVCVVCGVFIIGGVLWDALFDNDDPPDIGDLGVSERELNEQSAPRQHES